MTSRRTAPIFLLSLIAILLGLWLALGRSTKSIELNWQSLREAVSSSLDSGLLANIRLALAGGHEISFYLTDSTLLIFAGIALLAVLVTGLAIWRITIMSWEAARKKRIAMDHPHETQD